MTDQWRAVDAYIADRLLPADPVLDAVLAANRAAGLPAIDVAPVQGKLLHLIARIARPSRILEIGTLGGYSTIWLARALPAGGRLITIEADPHHAAVARDNLNRSGVGDKVEIYVGQASEALDELQGPFDLIFVDADKVNNVAYLRAALAMSRAGTTIIFDNVVRAGAVMEADSDDESVVGTRRLYDAIAAEPRLSATAVQTVGAKGWDGFLMAVVDG
ncbi:O-methyltransferase [Sphingomonas sp.]|uniref:O-methyltransferase n=1 Tax=Sphingomonas sp. TaxID=28214 RepID=UPI002C22B794|nr:O-methyltransferase [Sphingomonas sp.]HWK37039.1 O-methyltransferase [Sphingomonas sp.]